MQVKQSCRGLNLIRKKIRYSIKLLTTKNITSCRKNVRNSRFITALNFFQNTTNFYVVAYTALFYILSVNMSNDFKGVQVKKIIDS